MRTRVGEWLRSERITASCFTGLSYITTAVKPSAKRLFHRERVIGNNYTMTPRFFYITIFERYKYDAGITEIRVELLWRRLK